MGLHLAETDVGEVVKEAVARLEAAPWTAAIGSSSSSRTSPRGGGRSRQARPGGRAPGGQCGSVLARRRHGDVAARRRDDAVEVSVEDEGVGISPTEQERIFRKFYRGDRGPRASAPARGHRALPRAGPSCRDGRTDLGGGLGRGPGIELRLRARGLGDVRRQGAGTTGGGMSGSGDRRRGADPAALPGESRGRGDAGPRGADGPWGSRCAAGTAGRDPAGRDDARAGRLGVAELLEARGRPRRSRSSS